MTWGTHWYEADGQWEVLLEDASDIEILVESLVDEEVQVEKVSLEGLPKRTDYSLRLLQCGQSLCRHYRPKLFSMPYSP